MLLHLFHGGFVDQGAGCRARFQAIANRQLLHGGRQLLCKGVINARLHIDAVGANAGLAVVAELGNHRTFDGLIQIGIVKHDEGRVAAQFHRAFQHLFGCLTQQNAAHFGRTGEGKFAHGRVLAELFADVGRPARGDDRKHTTRHASTFCQHRQRNRRQRRFGGRAADKAAASGQGRGHFPRDHRVGKVPRRDRCGHANRLFDHRDALVTLVAGNGFAVDALGLFAEPFDKACAVHHFALRLGQGLALLGGEDRAKVVLVGNAQVVPFAQNRGAFLAGARRPFVARLICGGDGAGGIGARQVGHTGDDIAARRVGDGKGRAICRVHPFSGHIGLVGQKRWVFKQSAQIGYGIEHSGPPNLVWDAMT